MKKKLHELVESRREEMKEHFKKKELPDTHFGDTKTAKDRLKKKSIISKVLNKFK